ncbi:MAG: glycosyltransferase family 9 protein [Candidatus Omnitrophica bacterium]|nr:glycosyltransferase family 9 protein [Candidatus Omnitrophota bacterium]
MKLQESYRSFLVINTFGIGDVLFSTPLLRNLHNNFPKAKIYYLCNKKTAPLLRMHPLIEKVFVYERDEFVKEQKKSFVGGLKKYCQFIFDIRKEHIDCAIDLSLNAPFGFFALLAGIKKRYGLNYKNRSRFLNRTIKIDGFIDKHVVDYYLDTLKLLDSPIKRCNLEVYTDDASKAWAGEFLSQNGISKEQFVIGIAPCGGDAFGKDNCLRRWPPEQFSLLIDWLAEEYNVKIFIFAGPKEKNDVIGIISPVKHKKAVFDLSDLTLEETVALVERCQLFISNDSGILRFADGLNKKIVALYGPIDEKVYGLYPYDQKRTIVLKKDMPCRPCYNKFRLSPCNNDRRCLRDITVDVVMQAVRRLLN